jgi:hypothetical protein
MAVESITGQMVATSPATIARTNDTAKAYFGGQTGVSERALGLMVVSPERLL